MVGNGNVKNVLKNKHWETITRTKKNGMKLQNETIVNVGKNSKNLKQIYLALNVMNRDIGF
jgi:hypothetical protein